MRGATFSRAKHAPVPHTVGEGPPIEWRAQHSPHATVSDRLAVLPQYLLPKQALTTLMGRLAGLRGGRWTTAVIRRFIARYGVDMSEAANSDPAAYATFNEFFTRALRHGARPLAAADLICPVDGAVSQFGAIERDQIFQAKGTTTAPVRCSGAMRPWRRSSKTGTSPPSTSAHATTTASTCPARGGFCAWCTYRESCSR